MRFSEFDAAAPATAEAWNAIGLSRIPANVSADADAYDASSDLVKAVLSRAARLFDKTVLLYARAASVVGDLDLPWERTPYEDLNLDVFRLYRPQLDIVLVNLQAGHAKITENSATGPAERLRTIQKVERDLIKNLEFMYVLFACAITAKGVERERVNDLLHKLGFLSDYEKSPGIPWQPILKAGFSAAAVLLLGMLIAANTFQGANQEANIPTDPIPILVLLSKIIFVHICAVAQSMRVRNRLIMSENYYTPESGTTSVVSLTKIFVASATVSLTVYSLINLSNLLDLGDKLPTENFKDTLQVALNYMYLNVTWSLVPAWCGVLTAVTIDRSSNTMPQRVTSGLIEGCVMGAVSLLAVAIINKIPSLAGAPNFGYNVFNFVMYGGVGFVLGFMLPAEVRRYWAALENRLPDKISVLRTAVIQYFYDIQQFAEWLNTRNDRLEGKRPLDVLTEDGGVQRLVSFVTNTRPRVSHAAA